MNGDKSGAQHLAQVRRALALAAPGRPQLTTALRRRNFGANVVARLAFTDIFYAGYRDPVVAKLTLRCDRRIADFVQDSRPAALYFVGPPSDISRTKPLARLILNQISRRLTDELTPKSHRHRGPLMLDEFPALGCLNFFKSALAFIPGYGLKSLFIEQSLNLIEKAYGADNAILVICPVRAAFATNDERTAKRVSDALGTAAEMGAMKNYAGQRPSPWLRHLMVSRQETVRALLTGEVMQLPPRDETVLVSCIHPILAKKAHYLRIGGFRSAFCRHHRWLTWSRNYRRRALTNGALSRRSRLTRNWRVANHLTKIWTMAASGSCQTFPSMRLWR